MSEMNALDIIKGASILTANDWENLSAVQGELRQTWETAQIFRTRTEMKISVLKDVKFPTPDAKYWQAVREQNVMFCELVALSYEYRKKAVETRILQRDVESETDDLKKELKQIEVEQSEWQARNMERIAHDRIREILEWSEIKRTLKPLLKYGTGDVDAHQFEAMGLRYEMEASLVGPGTPPADARNILGLRDMVNKEGRRRLNQ